MLLYNSSNLNLGLTISLRDNFTGPASRVKSAFKDLKDEKRLFEANVRAGRDMYGALAAAGTAVTIGLGSAYAKGAKFDFTMRGVAAASEATTEQFKELKKQANALGGESMFKPSQVAGAMEMLAKAGLGANDVLAATAPIINLAAASMEDLGTSADIAISTMYQWGYAAKDLGYISDVLVQAALKSNIGVKDIGESLKYASATARDMGQDLETVLALTMTLGNAGMKGSMAGVGIENMYRYMATGLGQFAKGGRSKAWELAGLNPRNLVDAKGNLVPLVQILQELERGLSKFGDIDKQNILFQIFGVRGKRPPSKFIQDLQQVTKSIDILKQSGGKAGAQAEFMMAGAEGSIKRIMASLESMANAFTEAMAPVIIPMMEAITKVFRAIGTFVNSPIGGALTRVFTTMLLIKTVTWSLKFAVFSVTSALTAMGGTVKGVAVAWTASMAMMKASAMQLAGITTLAGRGGASPMGAAYIAGNSRLRQASNGAYYALGKNGGRSRFVSTATASRYTSMYGANTAGAAMRMGGLATLGKGLLAALGGPWGIAIVGIVSILPMIINALNKNTGALEKNKEAAEKSTDEHRKYLSYLTNEYSAEKSNVHVRRLFDEAGYGADNTDSLLARRLKEYLQHPNLFGGSDKSFYDYSQPGELRIYVDGKIAQTVKTQINRQLNASLQFTT